MMQTALVLQGGGALGAYELGVLQRLHKEPDFRPRYVSGVSIGAITAAVLVGARNGDPLATLATMWEAFVVKGSPLAPQILRAGPGRARQSGVLPDAARLYDDAVLDELLRTRSDP